MQIEKRELYQNILFTVFWVRTTFGFIADEFMPFLRTLESPLFLAIDFTIVVLGIMLLKKKWDIIFISTFIVTSYLITCWYNNISLFLYVNGIRDFITFLFIVPIINYFFENESRKENFIKAFDKNLFLFLLIQTPCLIWQFLKYGAGDHGGGSLGNWNSGIISTLIYLISFYLMQKRIDNKNYFTSLWKNKIYVILLFPTFLNETKISFVFLVLYFLLLLPIDKKMFIRILVAIPSLVILIWGGIVLYLSSTNGGDDGIFSLDYYVNGYFYNEDSEEYVKWLRDMDNVDDESLDIPRFTKFLLMPELSEENPGHELTGFGVGIFKGGTFVDNTDFYNKYEWLLVGSIPYLFHLLIQLGIVGLVYFIVFWVGCLVIRKKDKVRVKNLQLYIISVVTLILFYNDSLRNILLGLILIYISMLSWTDNDTNKTV